MMSYKWKPIISAGCILLYRWAVRPLKVLSRLKHNVSTFSMLEEWDRKQKEFNRETHRMPKKEEKKNVWNKNKSEGRRKMGGEKDRQSGRVRRRKHKSVALLGWMLTPVRDYWGEERGHMAAWQSGTHGEAAGTLACTGPSIVSSALRFAGRTGTLTMTSGSPTSVMAPGSQLTPLAKGQEEKNHLLRPASTELLMPLNNDPGTATKTTSVMVMGRLRLKAFTRRSVSLAPFKQQRRES